MSAMVKFIMSPRSSVTSRSRANNTSALSNRRNIEWPQAASPSDSTWVS